MIGEQHKLKDLEQLKQFVTGRVVGYSSHIWYGTLRAKYPLHFLDIMREHRNWCKTAPGIQFDDNLISEAIERINEAYGELQAYLLHPPKGEEQQRELDQLVVMLDGFLQQQMKEN